MSNKEKEYTTKRGSGFGGHGGMMRGGEKAKDFKKTMKRLIEYLSPYKKSIIVVVVFAVVSTIFSILGPRILGNITNQIAEDYINIVVYDQIVEKLPEGVTLPSGTTGEDILKMVPEEMVSEVPEDRLDKIKNVDFSERPHIQFDVIWKTILLLIGLYLVSALFAYLQGWIMSKVTQKISYDFRKKILNKIYKLPLKYFDNQTHGEVLSRITNDVDTVSQTLNQGMTQIITSVTTILGILIMMFSISWLLTLVAIVVLPVSFLFISFIIKKSQNLFKRQQDTLADINGHVEEIYAGHSIVKAFNGEKRALKKFNVINEDLYDSAWKSQFLSGLLLPIMDIVGNVAYVAIAVLGGWLAINNRLMIGDIQAFIQYMREFTHPITHVANITNVLQSTAAAAERIFEFLAEQEEVEDVKNLVTLDSVSGDVEFDHVRFGYDPDQVVIKDFSVKVKAGQQIAIVGPTGAGKTTLVNLLMRFYDVDSGSIKIDGVDIRGMRREDVRKMFGMVLQDTWLFNGTIKENISYGNSNKSDSEIIQAAKNAHVDHFIHSLPDGYDMVINEEADNISQGEKQLITIARAMLDNPPMLILDEATSSVDTRTELLIQRAMENLMKGRTTFVIAHRLSTIKKADLILVIDNGDIVEKGKHEELLKKNGFYASLYNSQFKIQ
ncbi:MAG: ABC-type multidrug/protein/lipid transport system, ATPase component [candidate division WS6 bacterium 34_10]|uniref:ABC-type multidrug/protein/lipid transport system, ATPase component n=1 Tax=candidate division WS6 bacterium 34_10 TaxID=1641389 RepID=A0A117M063_9BACT|nr:MAG: ABC-type multidrug/protein/lipid transport system, ATPase component [candidate division WS6 bacterium 34_10]